LKITLDIPFNPRTIATAQADQGIIFLFWDNIIPLRRSLKINQSAPVNRKGLSGRIARLKEAEDMPTLADVAKVAGVGVMSVSRVVHGTRRVTPEVERKVRAAIKKVGYEPNEAARILKGYRARVLGLIVPDLSDPFLATCANSIQETARQAGYMTLMAASGGREDVERKQTETMMQRHVAGFLVIPGGSRNEHFATVKKSKVPIVSLDRPLKHVETDTVMVDNCLAAAQMTEHLISHGHSQILCLADDKSVFTSNERIVGYSQAMRRAKLPVQIRLVRPIVGCKADKLRAVLDSVPSVTAIFAINNVLAIHVLRELQRREVQMPENMALAAFDDFDAATLVRPAITVVRQPIAELGKRAAELMLARLSNDAISSPSRIVLATELVIRQSCGCGRRLGDSAHRIT
jgi:LacI family transcriptional regulator